MTPISNPHSIITPKLWPSSLLYSQYSWPNTIKPPHVNTGFFFLVFLFPDSTISSNSRFTSSLPCSIKSWFSVQREIKEWKEGRLGTSLQSNGWVHIVGLNDHTPYVIYIYRSITLFCKPEAGLDEKANQYTSDVLLYIHRKFGPSTNTLYIDCYAVLTT